MQLGKQAEEWIISLLRATGSKVIRASKWEDKIHKVDFWVSKESFWLAIQFTVNKKAIISDKGVDALHRHIVPSWIDCELLDRAVHREPELQPTLADKFWQQVESILKDYPECKVCEPNVNALNGKSAQLVGSYRSG